MGRILGPDGKPAAPDELADLAAEVDEDEIRLDMSYWCDHHATAVTLGMAEGTLSGPKATEALLVEWSRLPWVKAAARRLVADQEARKGVRIFVGQAIVAIAMKLKPLCCHLEPAWLQRALDAGRTPSPKLSQRGIPKG